MRTVVKCLSKEVEIPVTKVRGLLTIVLTDCRFDPDLADDLDGHLQAHACEAAFLTIAGEQALARVQRLGWSVEFQRNVDGVTSEHGRITHNIIPPTLTKAVAILAPIIFCLRDRRCYVKSASEFTRFLNAGSAAFR